MKGDTGKGRRALPGGKMLFWPGASDQVLGEISSRKGNRADRYDGQACSLAQVEPLPVTAEKHQDGKKPQHKQSNVYNLHYWSPMAVVRRGVRRQNV